MLTRPAAVVAVELCTRCIALLREQRPHQQSVSQPTVAEHQEEMAVLLTTARATMQACADQDESVNYRDALYAVNRAMICFDQNGDLGEVPLPVSFRFDLIRIRVAICLHGDNKEWVENDRQPPILPLRDTEPAWTRKQAALDMVSSLLVEIDHLTLYPQLLELAAGVAGLSAAFLAEIQTALKDVARELDGNNTDYDLALRLVTHVWATWLMFEMLDHPDSGLWDIKGAIGTLEETLMEAKQDPDAPPIN
jgi:hypothetical protein